MVTPVDTSPIPDFSLNTFPRKSPLERPPVQSPISKSASRLSRFLEHSTSKDKKDFPLRINDWRMASRLRTVMGIPHEGKDTWKGETPLIRGKTVQRWFNDIKSYFNLDDILGECLVGSAASYVSGQPMMRYGLNAYSKELPKDLFWDIAGRIKKRKFTYGDVDLKLHVRAPNGLTEVKKKLQERWPEASFPKIDDENALIFRLDGLDVFIYTDEKSKYAFNIDNWRVDLRGTDLRKDEIQFDSDDPWGWLVGQVFGVIRRDADGDANIMRRLIGKETKGYVSDKPLEKNSYDKWKEFLQGQDAFRYQADKQQKDHDPKVPLGGLLWRLRAQQILLSEEEIDTYILQQGAWVHRKVMQRRFMLALFDAMKGKNSKEMIPFVHALVECIGLLALYEGWQKPFEVKLVRHEGEWHQRFRFRGEFGKRDLLVKFKPGESFKTLSDATPEQWKKMKPLLHSMWQDGIKMRKLGEGYRKELEEHLPPTFIPQLKKIFCRGTQRQPKEKHFVLGKLPSLAELLLPLIDDPDELQWLTHEILDHYNFTLHDKHALCWRAVRRCLMHHGFDQASRMIVWLRNEQFHPSEGWIHYFANLVQKNCNAALLKACNPFKVDLDWEKLSNTEVKKRKKLLLEMVDHEEISGEEILELLEHLRYHPKTLPENVVCKILQASTVEETCAQLKKYHVDTFKSKPYQAQIDRCIEGAMHLLPPALIAVRFNGPPEHLDDACDVVLRSDLEIEKKVSFLKKHQIKSKKQWELVASEYLRQKGSWPEAFSIPGHNPQTLATWCEVINKADQTEHVLDLMKNLDDPPGGRGPVLIQILKNWKTRKADPRVLQALDPGKKKAPWDKIVQGASTPERVLTKLKKHYGLYTSFLRVLQPQEEHFHRSWVKATARILEKQKPTERIKSLEKPAIFACMQLDPRGSLPLLKQILSREGLPLIGRVLTHKKHADKEILFLLMKTAVQEIQTAARFFRVLHQSDFHNVEYRELLNTLAIEILDQRSGSLDIAAKIWREAKEKPMPARLPQNDQLFSLLRKDCDAWIAAMLNKASQEELRNIDPKIYEKLLQRVNQDVQCTLLTRCRVTSEKIVGIWNDRATSSASTLKMVLAGISIGIAQNAIAEIAAGKLPKMKKVEIDQDVIDQMVEMVAKVDPKEGYQLWLALEKSGKASRLTLWDSGMALLQNCLDAPPKTLVLWLMERMPKNKIEEFMKILPEIIHLLPSPSKITTILRERALEGSETSRELYWKHADMLRESVDDIVLLSPTPEQLKTVMEQWIERDYGKACDLLLCPDLSLEPSEWKEKIASKIGETDKPLRNIYGVWKLFKDSNAEILKRLWVQLETTTNLQLLCEVLESTNNYLNRNVYERLAELYKPNYGERIFSILDKSKIPFTILTPHAMYYLAFNSGEYDRCIKLISPTEVSYYEAEDDSDDSLEVPLDLDPGFFIANNPRLRVLRGMVNLAKLTRGITPTVALVDETIANLTAVPVKLNRVLSRKFVNAIFHQMPKGPDRLLCMQRVIEFFLKINDRYEITLAIQSLSEPDEYHVVIESFLKFDWIMEHYDVVYWCCDKIFEGGEPVQHHTEQVFQHLRALQETMKTKNYRERDMFDLNLAFAHLGKTSEIEPSLTPLKNLIHTLIKTAKIIKKPIATERTVRAFKHYSRQLKKGDKKRYREWHDELRAHLVETQSELLWENETRNSNE